MSLPPCPQCNSDFVYQDQDNLVCPECGHEWNPSDTTQEDSFKVKDSNGTLLSEGDKVTLIKDLKVKGSLHRRGKKGEGMKKRKKKREILPHSKWRQQQKTARKMCENKASTNKSRLEKEI